MPFEVPGSGPMNPSGKGAQGSTFEEQPFESAGSNEQGSMFTDASGLFDENEKAKKPFNIKPIIFIAGGLIAVAVIAFVLFQVFSSGRDTRNISDMLEDPVEAIDGWESNEETPDDSLGSDSAAQQFTVIYTPAQLEELRAYGYTGDEIERFQAEGGNYQTLIDNALAKQAAQQIKTYNYLLKNSLASTDEAYKAALSMSWLGLPIPDVQPGEYDALGNPMSEYYSEQKKENVNYWKVPLAGNQCLLRLLLDDGTIVFFVTTPMDYLEKKKDYGNMVITYKRITYRGNHYITDIVEIEI